MLRTSLTVVEYTRPHGIVRLCVNYGGHAGNGPHTH